MDHIYINKLINDIQLERNKLYNDLKNDVELNHDKVINSKLSAVDGIFKSTLKLRNIIIKEKLKQDL